MFIDLIYDFMCYLSFQAPELVFMDLNSDIIMDETQLDFVERLVWNCSIGIKHQSITHSICIVAIPICLN